MGARVRRDRLAALSPALQRSSAARAASSVLRSPLHQVVDFASREVRVALRLRGPGAGHDRDGGPPDGHVRMATGRSSRLEDLALSDLH